MTFICNCIIFSVCFYLCKVTEIPAPAIASNPLSIQNPAAAANYEITNDLKAEEIELNTINKANSRSDDHGAVLERTNENGARVELSDNEPRRVDMTTGERPGLFVQA